MAKKYFGEEATTTKKRGPKPGKTKRKYTRRAPKNTAPKGEALLAIVSSMHPVQAFNLGAALAQA